MNRTLEMFRQTFARCETREARICCLRIMAELKFRELSARELKARRERFNANKGKYYRLRGECRACGGCAQVRHHIIQLSYGGLSGGENLIRLCNECHEEVHPWMKNAQQNTSAA